MSSSLPYIMIAVLLIAGWNESFQARYDRLTGKKAGTSASVGTQTAAATPAPTPKPFAPSGFKPIDLGAKLSK